MRIRVCRLIILLDLFSDGEPIFIISHLVGFVVKISNDAASEILKFSLKNGKVDDDLESLIRKSEYVVEEKITAEEAEAKKVASKILRWKSIIISYVLTPLSAYPNKLIQ